MEKNNRGSILIWSVFLVLFISFAFLFIAWKIQNNIENISQTLYQWDSENTQFQNVAMETLPDGRMYQREFFDSFSGKLITQKPYDFSFSWSQNISVSVSWGLVHYEVYSGWVKESGWQISGNFSQILSDRMLRFMALSGNPFFEIHFSSFSGVTFPYNSYKIYKEIDGYQIATEYGKD